MLPTSSSVSTFELKAENSFISKCDLIALYDSLVIYSYNGKEDFAYCKELYLSDEPYVTLYSVKYEQKFRNLKIKDFDFIYGKSFDDLKKIFFLDCA